MNADIKVTTLLFFYSSFLFFSQIASSGETGCINPQVLTSKNNSINIIIEKTIHEIEKEELRPLSENGEVVPFGDLNKKWEKFKSSRIEDDCVVYFKTDDESSAKLYGREGYILVRNGQPIDAITVRLN